MILIVAFIHRLGDLNPQVESIWMDLIPNFPGTLHFPLLKALTTLQSTAKSNFEEIQTELSILEFERNFISAVEQCINGVDRAIYHYPLQSILAFRGDNNLPPSFRSLLVFPFNATVQYYSF